MKAVIKEQPKPINEYPRLMKADSGMIVLMTAHGEGTVVANSILIPIGGYSKIWPMSNFTPFTGTIELSND